MKTLNQSNSYRIITSFLPLFQRGLGGFLFFLLFSGMANAQSNQKTEPIKIDLSTRHLTKINKTETIRGYATLNLNDDGAPVKANFTYSARGLQVSFLNLSEGNPRQLVWEFGDGSQSFEANPTHRYSRSGTYTIKLRVSGEGRQDVFAVQLNVKSY